MPDEEMTKKMLRDPVILRALRNLCPKKGSGCDSVTISSDGRSTTLTAETREKLNARLRRLK